MLFADIFQGLALFAMLVGMSFWAMIFIVWKATKHATPAQKQLAGKALGFGARMAVNAVKRKLHR